MHPPYSDLIRAADRTLDFAFGWATPPHSDVAIDMVLGNKPDDPSDWGFKPSVLGKTFRRSSSDEDPAKPFVEDWRLNVQGQEFSDIDTHSMRVEIGQYPDGAIVTVEMLLCIPKQENHAGPVRLAGRFAATCESYCKP
jgi:hypothetical protein